MKHTQEPWTIDRVDMTVHGADGYPVLRKAGRMAARMPDVEMANLERALICVNVMEGRNPGWMERFMLAVMDALDALANTADVHEAANRHPGSCGCNSCRAHHELKRAYDAFTGKTS